MRTRTAGLLLLLVLFAAIVAVAQPKKKPGRAEPSQPAEAPNADGGARSPAAEADDDLGPAPPTPARTTNGAVRPSPLTPRADELPDGGIRPPPPDYDRLLGEIATLRGRVAALTTTLFASKLRVVLRTEGDMARVQRLVVTLDDGVVYRAPERFSADDELIVYEHAVAPGHHMLGVEIERIDRRSSEYQTYQNNKFSIVIPESKLVEASIELEDDSDMAEDFVDDGDGEYDISARLRARVID
jgi:hypothetical protein